MSSESNQKLWTEVQALSSIGSEKAVEPAVEPQTLGGPTNDDPDYPPPVDEGEPFDLQQVRSALIVVNPDCGEKTWACYCIGALADAAREYPEHSKALFALAVDWSSGKLRGRPADMWAQAGEHGLSRRLRIASVWRYFQKPKSDKRVTIRSLFFVAREQGWSEEANK